jgi:hypothetical protein
MLYISHNKHRTISYQLAHGLQLGMTQDGHCYDLPPCHTIIQMFSSDFHDAAYCKDLYLYMVRHVHIFLCTFL